MCRKLWEESVRALAVIAGGPGSSSRQFLFRLWGSLVRHHPATWTVVRQSQAVR